MLASHLAAIPCPARLRSVVLAPRARCASGLAAALVLGGALAACVPPVPPQPATVQVVAPVAAPEGPPKVEGYHCDGTPFKVGDREVCAYATPLPWQAAKRACADAGGRLASFGSDRKAAALFDALGPPIGAGKALWFGLTEPSKVQGEWRWLDGTRPSHTNWDKGEPNNDGGNETCGEWKLGAGTWNDAPCFEGRGYICERQGTAPMTCEGGQLVRTRAGQYCFHLSEDDDWDGAKDACAASGGALAVLSTEDEDTWLHQEVGPRLGLPAVWVGLNDIASEGVWKWVSGERASAFNWRPGEPNDFRDDEDCVEWFSEDGGMNDLSCTEKLPYLCEPAPPK